MRTTASDETDERLDSPPPVEEHIGASVLDLRRDDTVQVTGHQHNINSQQENGTTILHDAATKGDRGAIRTILQSLSVDCTGAYTPLTSLYHCSQTTWAARRS